jgi:hypothetical protein
MTQRKMMEGGTRLTVAALLLAETQRRGHAIHMRELRDVLPAEMKARRVDVPTILNVLIKRGLAVVVTGRRSRRQYRHSAFDVPAAPSSDLALLIYDVLCEVVERLGRPATCAEVTEACHAKNIALKKGGVSPYLFMLTHASYVREPGAHAQTLVAVYHKNTLAGRSTNLWAPVGAVFRDLTWQDADVPPLHTANERLRQALALVERATGRPVRRRDLTLWRHVHWPTNPVARELDPVRVSCRLQLLLGQDSENRDPWKIARVRTPFTGAGATAPWYHVPGISEGQLPVAIQGCVLEDATVFYRVAREAEDLTLLRANADDENAPSAGLVRQMLAERDRLLRYLITDALGADANDVLANCDHALSVRQSWRDSAIAYPELRRRKGALPSFYHSAGVELNELREGLDAIRRMVLDANETGDDLEPDIVHSVGSRRRLAVGEACEVLAKDVLPLAECAARTTGGFEGRGIRGVLKDVRRMPGGGTMAIGADFDRRDVFENVRLDRVDAVLACVDAVGAPRTAAILQRARSVLGHVLRDMALLQNMLASESEAMERRTLVVVLALLGHLSGPEVLLIRGCGNEDEIAVLVVASVLAAPTRALEALEAIREFVEPARSDLLETALFRCETGNLLSLVD